MTRRRWYPRPTPPSGRQLWDLLQQEVILPPALDLTNGGKDAVGSYNYLQRKVDTLEQVLRQVTEQRNAAHELIQRSANLYLRYFVYRRKLLLWWRRLRG